MRCILRLYRTRCTFTSSSTTQTPWNSRELYGVSMLVTSVFACLSTITNEDHTVTACRRRAYSHMFEIAMLITTVFSFCSLSWLLYSLFRREFPHACFFCFFVSDVFRLVANADYTLSACGNVSILLKL
jgi:hypothetical protein